MWVKLSSLNIYCIIQIELFIPFDSISMASQTRPQSVRPRFDSGHITLERLSRPYMVYPYPVKIYNKLSYGYDTTAKEYECKTWHLLCDKCMVQYPVLCIY